MINKTIKNKLFLAYNSAHGFILLLIICGCSNSLNQTRRIENSHCNYRNPAEKHWSFIICASNIKYEKGQKITSTRSEMAINYTVFDVFFDQNKNVNVILIYSDE